MADFSFPYGGCRARLCARDSVIVPQRPSSRHNGGSSLVFFYSRHHLLLTTLILVGVVLANHSTVWGFAPLCPSRRQEHRSFAAAAGFGGGSSSSGTKKTTKKQQAAAASSINNTNKKIRAVRSGHAAAGSKVLRQSALAFDRLRKDNKRGVVCGGDVYIRSPIHSPTTFWYVGKVAFEGTGVSANTACIAHKSLIFEYAKQELRPQNFGGKYAAALELWLAPPDSEMDVVRNIVDLVKVQGSVKDLPDDFEVECVGYNPEIYVGDERAKGGLRVERDEEGKPTGEVFDVNESA